jgi:xylan 1,4-beta-xylosidase
MVRQLRAVLEAGYRPRVVLDNVPATMSAKATANAYGNTEPPADERVWHRYVEMAVRAMVEAFGEKEVLRWSFRVGTEPDLYPGHWTGTKEQYFAHYDFTVDAVRRVLPKAGMGPGNILKPGPLLGGGEGRRKKWGLEIIDHVGEGRNAVTGEVGTAMDVFSASYYARVGKPTDAFDRSMGMIRERLAKYPRFKDVAIECGEFAVLHDERGRRLYAGDTTEWSASFFAALAARVYRLDVKELYEWNHATHGVMHPRGRVIEMLERMVGGRRLAVNVAAGTEAECGAVAARRGEVVQVLVYNHWADRARTTSEKVRVVVRDRRMRSGSRWKLTEWTVDREKASWAYAFAADCAAAGVKQLEVAGNFEGSPSRLYGSAGVEVFRKHAAKYAKMSEVPVTREEVLRARDGEVVVEMEMAGHSVRFMTLDPVK